MFFYTPAKPSVSITIILIFLFWGWSIRYGYIHMPLVQECTEELVLNAFKFKSLLIRKLLPDFCLPTIEIIEI